MYGCFPKCNNETQGLLSSTLSCHDKEVWSLIKTLKFESKNSYFKSNFQLKKKNNRKNVCYSMTERHQMLMYIHYAKSTLLDFKDSLGICNLYHGCNIRGSGTLCS